ncbi:MAG: hypothetical protein Ct9H300mP16_16710 [Pseudomonadota bacterium]|nr:MAG: hypothetical protein Ct9H300mP16_16710 [Pseudomonadota bacterium]
MDDTRSGQKAGRTGASDDRVIEVGTGGSSLFLPRGCRAVLGAEPNLEWGESVVAEARSRGLGISTLLSNRIRENSRSLPVASAPAACFRWIQTTGTIATDSGHSE